MAELPWFSKRSCGSLGLLDLLEWLACLPVNRVTALRTSFPHMPYGHKLIMAVLTPAQNTCQVGPDLALRAHARAPAGTAPEAAAPA